MGTASFPDLNPGELAVLFFMANIQHIVTKRHDWQHNRLHNPLHPRADHRGFVMGMICMNCRKPWYPDEQGSPPLAGCIADIQVKRVGSARQGDYLEQEMRFREQQERVDPRDLPREQDLVRMSKRELEELAEQMQR